ncbi:substrate-binding domain-containing protein [Streptomyces sp. NPDC007861]|uniref:substrate-binding domain-containing protein n=1 Tax=Streptomyces sp. NPDC007861 TaxID=3154893 RepID=UPI0034027BBE
MRPTVEQRHQHVLEMLRQHGSLKVAEVAAELGISVATVRRDAEALEADGKLRRVPESVARPERPPAPAPLPDEGGRHLGLVVPSGDYFFTEIVNGAREAAEARGAHVTVALSHWQWQQDVAHADRLLAQGVDGLILMPSWSSTGSRPGEGEWIVERDVPTVLLERRIPARDPLSRIDRVCTDHRHGMGLAIGHLAALGHQRIMLAVQDTLYAKWYEEAYFITMEEFGLARPSASVLKTSQAQSETVRRDTLLDGLYSAVVEDGVTAALVHTSLDALVMIPRLAERGIRVPEDLALIACDDDMAQLANVPLTAIVSPKRALGEAAVDMLLSGRSTRRRIELLPELTVRESCGGS